jgi:uncharacterized protein
MPNYIPLQDIINRTVSTLQAGDNIILSGHRRIGKTLLMQHIEATESKPFIPTYLIVESVDSVNEFYRKLLFHLVDKNFIGKWELLGISTKQWLKSINIEEIGAKVRFGNPKEIDYQSEFEGFLEKLAIDRPIVLMLDEFPQVLENIRSMEGETQVRQLLTGLREIRQDSRIKAKVRFLLAGSIGLQNVVEGMGMTKHINDLKEIKMRSFTPEEAEAYLQCLFAAKAISASPRVIDSIKRRINHLVPFYLSLLVDELSAGEIDNDHIDQAFEAILGHRNNFEHWHNRLKPQALKPEEYRFCKTLLNTASDPDKPHLNKPEITNIAVQHDVIDELPRLLNILVHDGYLVKDESMNYRFISPVLRAWWWREIAN